MLFVLQLSFFVSAAALTFGIARKSWGYMPVNRITFLPIAHYYFFGVNNGKKRPSLNGLSRFIFNV